MLHIEITVGVLSVVLVTVVLDSVCSTDTVLCSYCNWEGEILVLL
jgi:hypothetical protein